MELQVPIEELQKHKLFVATPMYGGMCFGSYTKSILDLSRVCQAYGIACQFSFIFNESLITRARNYLVDEFMRSEHTHLMFIDSDIDFNPNDVIALLALNKPVIGGSYPKKCLAWENIYDAVKYGMVPDDDRGKLTDFAGDFVFNAVPGTNEIKLNEPTEVLEIGTGFMMIERGVFTKFAETYPQYWYNPDHNRSTAFDGNRQIFQYFQAEIEPERGRYLSEDYWFCAPASTRVETEDGPKTIRALVTANYTGNVKSLNEHGVWEWKPVVGWSCRSNRKLKKVWVKLNTTSDNNRVSKLCCTTDHQVMVCDNVFAPVLKYVEAKDTAGSYIIRLPQTNQSPLYNPDQLQVLMGTLLGDGSVTKHGQVNISHSDSQADYLEHKQKLLHGSPVLWRASRGFGENHIGGYTTLPVNAQTKALRKLLYPDTGKKNPLALLPMLDERAVAYWVMDDGCRNYKVITLSTCGYTKEQNEGIAAWFNDKWQIAPKVCETKLAYKGEIRTYWILRFSTKDSAALMALIAPYVIPSMSYKLMDEFRQEPTAWLDSVRLDFAAAYVTSTTELPNYHSQLYDIEVADNHNFVAQHTVVHNCQKTRQAGMSVWFAPWMQVRHHGTYIYGGSIPAMAAVINERIQRKDAVPDVVRMDNTQQGTTISMTDKLTVKMFSEMNSANRRKLLETTAKKMNVDVTVLAAYYKKHRDEWLATSPTTSIEPLLQPAKTTE